MEIPAGDEVDADLVGRDGVWPLIVRLAPQPATTPLCPPSDVLPRFVAGVQRLVMSSRPDGLGIIGGETAKQLLSRLGANRLVVHGRMSEVIAYGIISDGVMSGCPLTTKGGSVGPEAAVVEMIDYLLQGMGADR
jgi:hypothetical protein